MLEALKKEINYGLTENGSLKHNSTLNATYDLFALGGAYRNRSDADIISLFDKAYCQDPILALKCLFYIRDIRGGLGERKFFRVILKHLAQIDPELIRRNLENIPYFGRWDDLYSLFNTSLENDALYLIKEQLNIDVASYTPSLLAKWLKSENTSSKESRRIAKKIRNYLGLTSKQYRKTLSILRAKIRLVENLMSSGQWDKIQYDKIPSQAGLKYRNAFAKHDYERYNDFIKNKTTKVNANTLYPYEIISKVISDARWGCNDIKRASLNKYWDNLINYFDNSYFNGLVVCDTSASMRGSQADAPINVAISLAMYCAERADGPFKNHYISFSRNPRLVEVVGSDFVQKVINIFNANLCENTDLERVFDLLLNTAIKNKLEQNNLPEHIVIISDMEIDRGTTQYVTKNETKTLMENIRKQWLEAGYKLPKLIYWNVDARHDTFLDLDNTNDITYVSGCSPVIFKSVLTGKTSYELCLDILLSPRYECVK